MSIKRYLPPSSRSLHGFWTDTAERLSRLEAEMVDARSAIDSLQAQNQDLHRKLDESIQLLHEVLAANRDAAEAQRWAGLFSNPELAVNVRRDTSKPQLLVAGYYGASNLGDELMLETVLTHLRNSADVEITVMLSDEDPQLDTSRYGAVHTIHYARTCADFNVLAHTFDALLFGGGAVLVEDQYHNSGNGHIGLAYALTRLGTSFLAMSKPCFAWGMSTTSCAQNTRFKADVAALVRGFDAFSVRDPYSMQSFVRWGADKSKLKLVDDVTAAHPFFASYAPPTWGRRQPIIVITWMCFEEQREPLIRLLNALVPAIERASLADARIQLVPFFERPADGGEGNDTTFFKSVIADLDVPTGRIGIARFNQTMKDAARTLASARSSINMRYHGAYLNGLLGNPSVSIVNDAHPHYGNKMRYTADAFPHHELVLLSEMDANAVAERAVSNIVHDPQIPLDSARAITERARETMSREVAALFASVSIGPA